MIIFKILFLALVPILINGDEIELTTVIDTTTSTTTTTTTTTATVFVPKPNTTVCYDDYVGCFDNNFPFNNTALYLPIAPQDLKTDFYLYTNLVENDTELLTYLNEDTIKNSRYNKNYPLKIVIHGFQNTGRMPWVVDMATALIKGERGKANVIAVDWELGALFPLYNNASSNTRLVGKQTCLIVKLIRKVFYQDMWSKDFNVHCIGHSLGAHTCGYASNACDNMFDRITAMDPAGPLFESADIRARIDPSDAKFVDVIHSNGDNLLTGNLGMSIPCGHVDFYPNGGKQQPGCPGLASLITGLFTNASGAISSVSCSHGRAIYYFTESITSPCTFFSFPCDNYATFEKGDCLDCSKGGCTFMGYHASTKSRGVKYSMTRSGDPFCAYPYLVELTISVLEKKTAGELLFWFQVGSKNATAVLTKSTDDIISSSVYRKVFIAEIDILDVDRMYIQFNKKPKPLFGADTNAPEVYIDKIRIIHGEVDNEVYSECEPGLKLTDKQSRVVDLKTDDCQLRARRQSSDNLLKKIIGQRKIN